MASIGMMIGSAIINAVAFTGANYLASYLSSDGRPATKPLKHIMPLTPNTRVTAPSFLIGSKPSGK